MLAPNDDIKSVLAIGDRPARPARLRRALVWAVVAVLVVLAGLWWWGGRSSTAKISYTTAPVTRGNLVVSVSATGTVQPVNEVEVGSELSGTVAAVNVDYNDEVKAGEVLAVINTDKLKAQANSSSATLDLKQAGVGQAAATVKEAQQALNRAISLAAKNIASQQDLDTAQATYDRAVAALASANADVKVAEANLAANQTDLAKATIRSPINGVVLNRNVETGQTVAASLSAPILFTIAEDLTRMQLLVDVDEADAGTVAAGQDATFTVAAYPERSFAAKVMQVRYASETVDGVVTYKGVLSVDNSDLAIRPGMTATAEIVVSHADHVLLIPNAALRYAPASAGATTGTVSRGNFLQRLMPRPPQQPSQASADAGVPAGQKRVFVLRNDAPVGVLVVTGATDGASTEIVSGGLAEGDRVITDSTATR
jgi:HlyD family secretion protein